MNISAGYQLTEIGEIPREWKIGAFSDLFNTDSKNGLNRPSAERGHGYPMINMKEIFANHKISDEIEMELVDMCKSEIDNFSVLKDDLLFARQSLVASGAGKCCIVMDMKKTCTFESHIIRVRLKNSFASLYYFYFLNSPVGRVGISKLITQVAAAGIRGSELKKLSVPIPPLLEQKKIADILSTVDENISETESLIEKTKVLKQGMMQRLLTRGIGHTEFKDTEIGRIPVEWEVIDFGSLCTSRTGKYQPTTSEIKKYIALEHLDQGSGRLLNFGSSSDTTSIKTEFHKNDVLFGKLRPYLKKFWLAQFDGVCSTEILALKANEKTISSIILYFVEQDSFIEMATGKAYGTKMPRASWKDIKAIQVPQIPFLEQQKIASILTSLDDQINDYQTKLTSLTKLKSALMQQLLTGKTRVKI